MTGNLRIYGALCVLLLSFATAQAQKPNTPRGPKPNAPRPGTITQETPPAPRIITSAEDQAAADELTPPTPTPISVPKPTPAPASSNRQPKQLRMEDVIIEQDTQRRTLTKIANSVNTLNTRISAIESQQRQTLDLQRLMYSEQRAENLRKQLFETQDKELDTQRKIEEVEFNLRPEVIERMASFSGSTRPDEVREQRRIALEKERQRLNLQLETLQKNRVRLESAVEQADREVDKLRARLDKESDEQRGNSDAGTPANATRPPQNNASGEPVREP